MHGITSGACRGDMAGNVVGVRFGLGETRARAGAEPVGDRCSGQW